MTAEFTKGSWVNGLAEWTEGDTAYLYLATACRPCNLAKGSKLIAEWRPSLLS